MYTSIFTIVVSQSLHRIRTHERTKYIPKSIFLRHIQTTDTRTVTKTNKLVKNKNPFMTGRNSTFYSTGTCTFKKSVFPREFLFCYRVLFLFYAFKHNSVKYQEHQSSNSNGLQRKLHDMRQTV